MTKYLHVARHDLMGNLAGSQHITDSAYARFDRIALAQLRKTFGRRTSQDVRWEDAEGSPPYDSLVAWWVLDGGGTQDASDDDIRGIEDALDTALERWAQIKANLATTTH